MECLLDAFGGASGAEEIDMEEKAHITAARRNRAIETGASHGGARPCLTIILDAVGRAVIGTVVTGADAPQELLPA